MLKNDQMLVLQLVVVLFCDPPIRISGMSSLADGTVIVGVAHHDGEPKLTEF